VTGRRRSHCNHRKFVLNDALCSMGLHVGGKHIAVLAARQNHASVGVCCNCPNTTIVVTRVHLECSAFSQVPDTNRSIGCSRYKSIIANNQCPHRVVCLWLLHDTYVYSPMACRHRTLSEWPSSVLLAEIAFDRGSNNRTIESQQPAARRAPSLTAQSE
jgi:hypothetical protein